jgi:C_GCAxxG_C_C family probable redox protein
MDFSEQAVNEFKAGFNCCQSVFVPFAIQMGLERDTALKLTTGFGAGMARQQETCGAVVGAYLALGLKFGRTKVEDEFARDETYMNILDFTDAFVELHGSINCKALLGCDLSSAEGHRQFIDGNLLENVCTKCVGDAARILSNFYKA